VSLTSVNGVYLGLLDEVGVNITTMVFGEFILLSQINKKFSHVGVWTKTCIFWKDDFESSSS
jgi:hypothetical protein